MDLNALKELNIQQLSHLIQNAKIELEKKQEAEKKSTKNFEDLKNEFHQLRNDLQTQLAAVPHKLDLELSVEVSDSIPHFSEAPDDLSWHLYELIQLDLQFKFTHKGENLRRWQRIIIDHVERDLRQKNESYAKILAAFMLPIEDSQLIISKFNQLRTRAQELGIKMKNFD